MYIYILVLIKEKYIVNMYIYFNYHSLFIYHFPILLTVEIQ